jgi:hypothetical protein
MPARLPALLALCGASLAAAAQPFTLYLLDQQKYPMAKCLDGSAPGYYHAPGWGNGSTSWVIHTQGGGWCVGDADCANRARSPLGSSAAWAPSGCDAATASSAPVCYADGGFNGMLSNSSDTNPLLYNWNKVFINCACCCVHARLARARHAPLSFCPWHPL